MKREQKENGKIWKKSESEFNQKKSKIADKQEKGLLKESDMNN